MCVCVIYCVCMCVVKHTTLYVKSRVTMSMCVRVCVINMCVREVCVCLCKVCVKCAVRGSSLCASLVINM